MAYPVGTAAHSGQSVCHVCLKLADATLHECPRCGAALHLRNPDSLQRTMALTFTGALLLLLANLIPMMYTDQLGRTISSTIIGGVILLWNMGSYPIAGVIFIASVMVPIGKIISLSYLCWSVSNKQQLGALQRTVMYRVTEFIGRWSMVDVFVVSIMVALIQLGGLLAFRPGWGAVAFGTAVILTMLAAENFDSRLIWDRTESDGALRDE